MSRFSLGLKLWSSDWALVTQAVALVREGYYEYIELFSVPDSFDVSIPYWSGTGVPFVIHAPHSLKGLNPAKRELEASNRRLAEEAFRFADALKSESVVFHPGVAGPTEESIRQLRSFRDPRCLVENKPMRGIDGSVCVGWSFDQIREILDGTGYRFCLDFGHAHCAAVSAGFDFSAFIKSFVDLRPALYHLTDGNANSEVDRHDRYGFGTFALSKCISYLPDGAFVTNEGTRQSRESLEEAREDAAFFKAIVRLNTDMPGVELKRARLSDVEEVFNLSNDSSVRAASFSTLPIQYERHVAWFVKKISDSHCLFLVFFSEREFLGQIRFQKESEGFYEVSISVASQARGRGVSRSMMQAALGCIAGKPDATDIIARVKFENITSVKFFEALGFIEKSQQEYAGGLPCRVFLFNLNSALKCGEYTRSCNAASYHHI